MHSFFLWWTVAVFVIGMIAITGALFVLLRWALALYFDRRINRIQKLAPSLWVWRACRAYRKISPLGTDVGIVYSVPEVLYRSLQKTIELAEEEGYTLAIEHISRWPLKMGNYRMSPRVYEGNHRYRNPDSFQEKDQTGAP